MNGKSTSEKKEKRDRNEKYNVIEEELDHSEENKVCDGGRIPNKYIRDVMFEIFKLLKLCKEKLEAWTGMYYGIQFEPRAWVVCWIEKLEDLFGNDERGGVYGRRPSSISRKRV